MFSKKINYMSKVGFFEEQSGVRSSNRLIFVIGMLWLMVLTTVIIVVTMLNNKENIIGVIAATGTIFSLIAAVFYGGKVLQKGQENKIELQNN